MIKRFYIGIRLRLILFIVFFRLAIPNAQVVMLNIILRRISFEFECKSAFGFDLLIVKFIPLSLGKLVIFKVAFEIIRVKGIRLLKVIFLNDNVLNIR
jgi:hypothetical protein